MQVCFRGGAMGEEAQYFQEIYGLVDLSPLAAI